MATAPGGQSVNIRITMSEGSGVGLVRPGGVQDFAGIRGRGGAQSGNAEEISNTQTDFNEQRLIIKGRLDPSVDNRGYANITRVVRDGGSAKMDGDTLVVENASFVMLLTRIEYLPDYSEEKVEVVRQSLEELTPDYPALLERARKVQSEMLNRITVGSGNGAVTIEVVGNPYSERIAFSHESLFASRTGQRQPRLQMFFRRSGK